MLGKIKITIMYALAFCAAVSVPVYFLAIGPSAAQILTGPLGIRVNPDLAGGEVMAVFSDEYFDDKGNGAYMYPQIDAYEPYRNHLDLLKYIVRKPVRKGVWNEYREFWAVEVVLGDLANPLDAPAGFSFPVIYIYISIDGLAGGRTDELFPGANVSFDPEHPWQFCIKVHGWQKDGILYNIHGETMGKVLIDIIHDETLRITMPLVNELSNISEETISYHYVLIGNYGPMTESNLRPASVNLKDKSSGKDKGIKKDNNTNLAAPNIYDYLAPAGVSQYALLSAFDNKNSKYAMIKPVKVVNGTGLTKQDVKQIVGDHERLIYENKIAGELKKEISSLEGQLKRSKDNADIMTELAILYFQAGDYSASENLFIAIQSINGGDNPVVLSYLGAITARKSSSDKNTLNKIKLVNESIKLLDRAKDLTDLNSMDAVHVLMCRGNVYSALPDDFNRRDEAINDLKMLSEMLTDGSLDDVKTDALILLGENYTIKRMPKRALDSFHEALRTSKNEYLAKMLKQKIFSAENLFIDTITMNF